MYQIHDGHEDESEPFDFEDSRAIAHAYSQCIMFPVDPDPLSGMRLDMYRYLLEFVSDLTVFPMPEELPLVTRAAIERLWMAFDTEKVELLITPDDRRSQVMYYFGDLSYAITQLVKRHPSKQSPKLLAEAFAHSDWPEAMARYMLLCFRKSKILTFPTPVDIDTLERIEQSRDVDSFLDPTAPRILYGLLQSHISRNPTGRVFDDRYGQICVRILIRLVQILVCENNSTLEYVKSKMDDAATNAEVSTFLAEHTAALAMGRTITTMSFLTASGLIGESKAKELFSKRNTRELLDILWRDRKSFFILYKNGSLQGMLLLLVYLVTFTEERNHIRSLCVKMYEIYPGHEDRSNMFDAEDSRAVIHAYNECIMFPVDPDPKSGMRLDMFRYLLEFVSDLTGPRMYEEPPLAARAAIERLWQAYDTEKTNLLLPPTNPRAQVMYYMGDLQYALA
ncbi:hypothetical protein FRC06_002067 [Ceratobasidium sp. 370]|nr:hypothetical protein FRC06_002067 [Ceratobasidium sp. 370]